MVDAPGTLTVGLVPSPGQCERISRDMVDALPGVLAERVDEIEEWRSDHGWDYAIAVTDLPVHKNDRIVVAYALIFLLLLTAALIYIPTSLLESTIQQPATPASFVRIAWITESVATIAGAVGAGLEDTDAVREATFGWRQHHRFEESQKAWGDESGKDD
jgi:hypothetical protein